MFPVIDLGPLALQAAGLILILSLWSGIWLMGVFSNFLGTHTEKIENSIWIGLAAGIVSARIGFLLQNPGFFLEKPLALISLTPSMLNASFGLLAGFLTIFIYAQRQHLPLLPTLDAAVPLVLLLFIGIHLAQLANGDGYGLPTGLPWGMALWNEIRHPAQMYALILAAVLFLAVLFLTKGLKATPFFRSGVLFFWAMTGIALITILTRAFVEDKVLIGGIDPAQVIGIIFLVGSLYMIYYKLYKENKSVSVMISLGSNQNPVTNLSDAISELEESYRIRGKSSLYQTQNVLNHEDAVVFHNMVIEITTKQPYLDLREKLKSIERQLGREKSDKHSVPIDLDILTYGQDVFLCDGKPIPHPNLIQYHYVTEPLAEIAPGFRHPATGKTISEISSEITKDDRAFEKISEVKNGIKR